jgi:hypothetical protein
MAHRVRVCSCRFSAAPPIDAAGNMKSGGGGDRDTLLVWLPYEMYPGRRSVQFEATLIEKLEKETETYPDARYTIFVESLEGISRAFSEIANARGIKIRVPVQFFDAPFRVEESPDVASAIKLLRDVSLISKRVPQPFLHAKHDGGRLSGSDLLVHIRKDLESQVGPCIRFVVGSAGAGKSVLFQSLFAIMYRDFIDQKNRLNLSHRPIPFTPEHLRSTYTIRTSALVDSFSDTARSPKGIDFHAAIIAQEEPNHSLLARCHDYRVEDGMGLLPESRACCYLVRIADMCKPQ